MAVGQSLALRQWLYSLSALAPGSLEQYHLPHRFARGEPIEGGIHVVQSEPVREQALHGQTTGTMKGDEARNIARRHRRAHVGTLDGALFGHQADRGD